MEECADEFEKSRGIIDIGCDGTKQDCTDTLLTYASYTWSWWPKTDAQWEEMAHGIEADPDQHFWDEFEK